MPTGGDKGEAPMEIMEAGHLTMIRLALGGWKAKMARNDPAIMAVLRAVAGETLERVAETFMLASEKKVAATQKGATAAGAGARKARTRKVAEPYVPKAGDLVWVHSRRRLAAGHGRHPQERYTALLLDRYNVVEGAERPYWRAYPLVGRWTVQVPDGTAMSPRKAPGLRAQIVEQVRRSPWKYVLEAWDAAREVSTPLEGQTTRDSLDKPNGPEDRQTMGNGREEHSKGPSLSDAT